MSLVIRMLVVVVLLAGSACAAPSALRVKATKFTGQAGQTVEAESGEIRVPERRIQSSRSPSELVVDCVTQRKL